MNKRERIENFLASKEVDRVPVAFYHHFLDSRMLFNMNLGLTKSKLFERNIESHRKALANFHPDLLKIMNDSLMIMPLKMAKVKHASDLKTVLPQGINSRWQKKSIELAMRVKEIYANSEAPILFTSFGPAYILRSNFARIGNLMMGNSFMESKIKRLIAEDEAEFKACVDRISEEVANFNDRLFKEVGIDGIYFSVNNQNDFFPPAQYQRIISPADKYILERANKNSSMNVLHICGYMGKPNHLDTFSDYEAAAYNWAVHAEGVSLTEGKKIFNGKPVFGGFEQNGVIAKGTREEVEAEVFRILDEAGQVGTMLGADCTVPTNIDDARLSWVQDAAAAYAKTH
ncbi:uroporphyrinogen decarboxylase family protein [Cutibacterium sp.]|uniref:uroporphyrinogen decarboxylase family protein n=1 Tax=Cutibacterium sp. TaxID=1912221 RepID=UPI0026DC2A66|nr:uroporphyrinogen decarboxylase family protein [Cutibacterium sp.]MDO4412095.1 uroporphyrinogen decarboxylase family protein [Cutibacterium sp.]